VVLVGDGASDPKKSFVRFDWVHGATEITGFEAQSCLSFGHYFEELSQVLNHSRRSLV